MGCIIAATGTKTLCGKKCTVEDVQHYFAPKQKITCIECIVRQDAMFTRGYEQQKYIVWYTSDGAWLSYLHTSYLKYGTKHLSIPRKSNSIILNMWDNKQVRGAIKLGKLGIHGMGLAK